MNNQRGSSLILIGVIVVLFFLAILVRNYDETADKEVLNPIPSPYVRPSPTNPFILFNTLRGETSEGGMESFTDDILKVSFSYPKEYFSKSYKADERHLDAGLFFIKERNKEREEALDYLVDCVLDNRIEPSGLCKEGTAGDLEVDINNETSWKYLDESSRMNDIAYEDDKCKKQTLSANKVIYSCFAQLSVDSSHRGMKYMLYFGSDSEIVITLTTGDPVKLADLITSIIDSAKISP